LYYVAKQAIINKQLLKTRIALTKGLL